MSTTIARSDPTAVVGRRCLAAIIDSLLLLVLVGVLLQSRLEYVEAPGRTCDDLEVVVDINTCFDVGDRLYFADDGDTALVWLAWLAMAVGVQVLLQGLTGWTPGKLVTGIRTVDEYGRRPGIGRALVRTLLLIVDDQPCGIPLVGFICALTSKGHRRVGDMAAKTYVVHRSSAGQPIRLPGDAATYGDGPWAAPQAGWAAPGAAVPGAWGAPVPTGPPTSPPVGAQPTPWAPPTSEPSPAEPASAEPSPWARPGSEPEPSPAPWAPPSAEAAPAQAAEPEPSAWAPPETPAATPAGPPPAVPPPAPTPAPDPTTPQWDAARNAYIVWEPHRGQWLQWDDAGKRWFPIS